MQRPGQLVTKEELLDRVWPNLVVEENNLQVQISALRKILGQEVIATDSGTWLPVHRRAHRQQRTRFIFSAVAEQQSASIFATEGAPCAYR